MQGLKAEINLLALSCPKYYNDEDWSVGQDQLMPQLCYLNAGVSWPRYYYDASGGFASAATILTSLWRQRGRRELCIGLNYLAYFEYLLYFPPRMVHLYDAEKEAFERQVLADASFRRLDRTSPSWGFPSSPCICDPLAA